MPLTSRKIQNATMMKFSVMVAKSPQASTRPGLLRIEQRQVRPGVRGSVGGLRLGDFFRQRQIKVREINIAQEAGNGRHDDVRDQRGDNLSERRADNHADREVNDIATQSECFELL